MFKAVKFLKFNALKFDYITGIYKTTFQKCKKAFSNVKKNERMAFAATWMDTEVIILSEVKRKISYDITYVTSKI